MLTQWNESLWGDEGFSALAVMRSFGETMGIVMRDTAPPLFYILGWIWGRMFGFDEVSLRSLSLLLMLGAAGFAGGIIYQIEKDKINAFLGFGLVFLTPFLMPFAFEWRMYALLNFTVLGSVYFFVRKKWGWYVLFSLMALYTHHFGMFTIMGEFLWFLISECEWKKLKKYLRQLWPFLAIGIGYLPWLYPMYLQISKVKGGGFWLSVPTTSEVSLLILKFVVGGVKKEWWVVTGLVVAVILKGKGWKKVGKSWIGLMVIFLAPVVLAYVVSYLVTPIFYDRYLLSVAVGMVILLVLGSKKWVWPVLVLLMMVYGYQSFNQFTHPGKRPFREMANYIKEVRTEDDFLLNYNGRSHHLWESKYYGIPAPIYVPGEPLPLYVGTAQMKSEDTVAKIPKIKGRLGIISSESVGEIEIPGYKVTEYKQFGELRFSWWNAKKK